MSDTGEFVFTDVSVLEGDDIVHPMVGNFFPVLMVRWFMKLVRPKMARRTDGACDGVGEGPGTRSCGLGWID